MPNSQTVHFESSGLALVGTLYAPVASDSQPAPAAILLHGIPGTEKNLDLAAHLCDLGWYALIVHYRGAWGSAGDYNMTTQPDDALAAVEWLLNRSANLPVDPQRMILIGYSLGSRAAIVAAHRDPRVHAIVSISGIAAFDEIMLTPEFYTDAAPYLTGATPQSLSTQWAKLGGADDPLNLVGDLKRPLLIVHGTADEVIPYYFAPALQQAGGASATLISVEGADHLYTSRRAELISAVSDWCETLRTG